MLGVSETLGWRLAMIVPGVVLFLTSIAYWHFTQDAPDGNFADLRRRGELVEAKNEYGARASFGTAIRDVRVWALFLVYGACFGVELTINNIAALYYFDNSELSLGAAGLIAGLFGLMNLFARALGGFFSDRFARLGGLKGRVRWLFLTLLCEGVALILFSQMQVLGIAIMTMVLFSLCVQMAEGATYGVVPFINRRALGAVAGIVGAGGNVGAVAAGFLFRSESLSYQQGLFFLGIAVTLIAFAALSVRFPQGTTSEADDADRPVHDRPRTPAGRYRTGEQMS